MVDVAGSGQSDDDRADDAFGASCSHFNLLEFLLHYIAVVPPLWRPLMMTGGNATWQSHCCPTLLGNQVPRSHIAVLAGFYKAFVSVRSHDPLQGAAFTRRC